MTVEDAVKAAEAGVDGIYLSNHGGRQLDYAPSSIRTLLEIRKFRPDILSKIEVYVDGGVRRGSDVLKAICLGATGVGLGRPFMYAVASGTDGVLRAIQLLSEEIETTMRLLGVSKPSGKWVARPTWLLRGLFVHAFPLLRHMLTYFPIGILGEQPRGIRAPLY
jgi:L-lactate dehydrogenase (cytochrome)